jgi:hypothetical protein
MIKPRFSILTLLVLIALVAMGLVIYKYLTAPVYPLSSDRYPARMTAEFPGVRVETDLGVEQLEKFPVWNRQRKTPPLSAGTAIELADRYRQTVLMQDPLIKSVNSGHDWVFRSVELAPLQVDNGIWVWVVQFNLRKNNIWYVEPNPQVVSIVVKMNGEIVEPRIL